MSMRTWLIGEILGVTIASKPSMFSEQEMSMLILTLISKSYYLTAPPMKRRGRLPRSNWDWLHYPIHPWTPPQNVCYSSTPSPGWFEAFGLRGTFSFDAGNGKSRKCSQWALSYGPNDKLSFKKSLYVAHNTQVRVCAVNSFSVRRLSARIPSAYPHPPLLRQESSFQWNWWWNQGWTNAKFRSV